MIPQKELLWSLRVLPTAMVYGVGFRLSGNTPNLLFQISDLG